MAKYMHTINGRPAFFAGEQICFLCSGETLSSVLRDSLKQIRDDQNRTVWYRRDVLKCGVEEKEYGYLRFKD